MGPYCKFCDRRCFVPLPAATPPEMREAYGTSTLVATCHAGQRYEKERIGCCYDDITDAIVANAKADLMALGQRTETRRAAMVDIERRMNPPTPEIIAKLAEVVRMFRQFDRND